MTTTRHDDAPGATGASHHITRPAQPSAPPPPGNLSGDRTDERPASCSHPVLWPLCGGAAGAPSKATYECECGDDPIPIIQIVIDTDPDREDLTVVHVCGRGPRLAQLVREAVDAARKLGQTILEIRPVSRIAVVDDRGAA